jgi:hypothetical protein
LNSIEFLEAVSPFYPELVIIKPLVDVPSCQEFLMAPFFYDPAFLQTTIFVAFLTVERVWAMTKRSARNRAAKALHSVDGNTAGTTLHPGSGWAVFSGWRGRWPGVGAPPGKFNPSIADKGIIALRQVQDELVANAFWPRRDLVVVHSGLA